MRLMEKKFYDSFNQNENYQACIHGDSLLNKIQQYDLRLDTNIADLRIYVALSNYDSGRFQKALEIDLKSQELFFKIWPKSNFRFLLLLNRIAWDYKALQDYSNSIKYFTEVYELNSQIYGVKHLYTASSLNNIGVCYLELGMYKLAARNFELALDIYSELFETRNTEIVNCESNLAICYSKKGDHKKSLKINQDLIEFKRSSLGEDHPDYLASLNNLAENQRNLGLFDLAQLNYLKCIKVQEEKFGIENTEYIQYLSNYSSLLGDIGKIDSSIFLNQKCLDLSRQINQVNNPFYITRLNNMGVSLLNSNNFSLAKLYFDSSIVISETTLGKSHPTTIQCYENLAVVFGNMKEYLKAIEIEYNCLRMIESNLGSDNLDCAAALNQLALYYSKLDLDTVSQLLNQKAFEIREKQLGFEHPLTLLSAYNLCVDYSNLGKHKQSLKMLENILKVRLEFNGATSFETKLVYNNIGLVHYDLGNYSKALEYFSKAYDENDDFADKDAIMLNISSCYEKMNNLTKAIEFQDSVIKYYLNEYLNNQLYLSENQKTKYKQKLDYYVNYLLLLNCKNKFKDKTFSWYNNYISCNNLINNRINEFTSRMSYVEKNKLSVISDQIKMLKSQKNKYIEQNEHEKIESLELEIDKLEIKLSVIFSEFLKKSFDYNQIQNKFETESAVFVDLIPIRSLDGLKNNYVSIILSKNQIFLVALDTSYSFVEDEYIGYKNQITKVSGETDVLNSLFFNSFWKPIADKIGDAKTVYVSLGGVYNNINLNTLYNPETGKYLIEEKDIRIVNSARDFVLMKEREKKVFTSNTSALYGFPDFNGNASMTVDTMDYFALTRDLDQQWIDSLTRGGMKAAPLPSTKVEVDQIAATFQKNGWNVKTYTGMAASEGNIKQEESPRVLHVATHGYFFEDIPLDKTTDRFLGMDRQRVVQDPMLRSGLLMTGANKTLQGEEMKGENGLLSAAEASLIDLRETELVVLSACETGKGEVKNSEGVYGLRKAFSDAGARNIIMSLWKVDDKVTQEFMTRFYEIWLNEKTSIREAFNRTQLEIKAKYPQPFYWGAFILVGD